MEINFNTEARNIARPGSVTPKAANPPAVESDASFQQSQALDAQLGRLPELRPEEVERGRALVSLSQYPPVELIHKISRLFVSNSDELNPPTETH